MKKILVTQPFLPPLDEYNVYLKDIWEKKWLTNNGEFHQKLELELSNYLEIKNISLFSNGTLALVTSLQFLEIKGEVITTPYSFVATTHSLIWNNITPVFVDIEPNTFNIDPDKIEAAITSKTTAILAVHVYGNPCDVEKIDLIAKKYNLKVIYDACHCFGVKINNKSILEYGDISVMSFHATKVFHTFEGGAVICKDLESKIKIDNLKNFGFINETSVVTYGINAKMNELQASMGLLQLKYIKSLISKRKIIAEKYRNELSAIKGIYYLSDLPNVEHSYSYFPILIKNEEYGIDRDTVYENFKKYEIYTRKYFYPLISQFPIYSDFKSAKKDNLPVAEIITKLILCLPMYSELEIENVEKICLLLKNKFS